MKTPPSLKIMLIVEERFKTKVIEIIEIQDRIRSIFICPLGKVENSRLRETPFFYCGGKGWLRTHDWDLIHPEIFNRRRAQNLDV